MSAITVNVFGPSMLYVRARDDQVLALRAVGAPITGVYVAYAHARLSLSYRGRNEHAL